MISTDKLPKSRAYKQQRTPLFVQIISDLFFDFSHIILTLSKAIYLQPSTFRQFTHLISSLC